MHRSLTKAKSPIPCDRDSRVLNSKYGNHFFFHMSFKQELHTLLVSPKRKFSKARKYCNSEHNKEENARTKRHQTHRRKRNMNCSE